MTKRHAAEPTPAPRAHRTARAPVVFSPTCEPAVARGRGRPRKDAAAKPVSEYVKHSNGVKNALDKLRLATAYLDAYDQDGWRGAR